MIKERILSSRLSYFINRNIGKTAAMGGVILIVKMKKGKFFSSFIISRKTISCKKT